MYTKQSTKIDKSNNLLETYNLFINGSNLTINLDSSTDLNLSSMFSLFDSINNYKISLINESMINGSDSDFMA